MKENVAKLSTDDNVTSSTNILKFIENFESDDESWIDEINKRNNMKVLIYSRYVKTFILNIHLKYQQCL